MRRVLVGTAFWALAVVALVAPASAQVVHSLNFGVGFFRPTPLDSRVAGDTIFADLHQPEVHPGITGSLLFDFRDFRAMPLFAEWLIALGDRVEVGVGTSFQNRSVNSIYRDVVDSHGTATTVDDTDIAQTLRLRMIPLTGVVRFVFGSPTSAQGYIGGGVSAVMFRYSETGQFVDFTDDSVYDARYSRNGVGFGSVLVGGARFALGGDVYALTFEGRYQFARANTGGLPNFLGEKIDLGGATFNIGFLVRY